MATCPVARAAEQFGDAPALLEGGRTWSFREWDVLVEQTAGALTRMGLKPGSRMMVRCHNSVRMAVLLTAAWRRGVTVCPVSYRFPSKAVADLCRLVRPDWLVVDDGERRARWHGPDRAVLEDLVSLEPRWRPRAGGETEIELPDAQAATILFTSGSTGRPRGVCHTLAAHLAAAKASNRNLPFGAGHRWLLSLAVFHVGGLAILTRALEGGGAVVFPREQEALATALVDGGATHVSVVATQLEELLATLERCPEHLGAMLTGGGPVPPDLVARAVAAGYPLLATYGATETASQVATTPPGAGVEALNTAGRALPCWQVRIGEGGEILVRGEPLLQGWLGDDGLQPAVDREGWYHTGDLGSLSDGGELTVLGRADQMFISGGENIHPEEIERVLCGHPHIREAVVVAVPHERYGARPVAFVRGVDDRLPGAEELERWANERLPRFKVPDRFEAWPRMPDQPGFKPDRRWLAERAVNPDRREE